jgi:DNA-binding MarR family transcriptional regulator
MQEPKSLKKLLFGLVKQARADIERQFLKAGLTITPFQFGVLSIIKHQPATLAEIAKKLGIKPPSAVPYIDGLEKQGLIVKNTVAKDRRKIQLKTTPKGQKLIKTITKDRPTDTLNRAFQKLSQKEQDQLVSILRKLSDNFIK